MRYEDLVYHKGDIYIAELGENFGHEQSGTRPVIIMQNDVGNYFSPTVTIVPLTSKDKKPGQPTHYRLDMKKYPFLTSSSTALCESPRTLDKRLLKRYLGSIDREDLEKGINLSEFFQGKDNAFHMVTNDLYRKIREKQMFETKIFRHFQTGLRAALPHLEKRSAEVVNACSVIQKELKDDWKKIEDAIQKSVEIPHQYIITVRPCERKK